MKMNSHFLAKALCNRARFSWKNITNKRVLVDYYDDVVDLSITVFINSWVNGVVLKF